MRFPLKETDNSVRPILLGSELITDAKVCGLTNGTNEDSPTLSTSLVGHRKIASELWTSVMFCSLCGGSVAHETVCVRCITEEKH